MIKAEIVGHSVCPRGNELVSVLATFPRIILSEINTHRMLSKNTSSSRAIPFKKMVEVVQENPFIPIAWQKHHSGMQGSEYFTEEGSIFHREQAWLYGRDEAVKTARELAKLDVTKQLANRLLEPFMWTTMLITGSKEGWDNFFELRAPQYRFSPDDKLFKSKKEFIEYENAYNGFSTRRLDENQIDWLLINEGQAEIHIMDLAEKIYDAMNESIPQKLKEGEWHVPFGKQIRTQPPSESNIPNEVKISTAMAARTSYTVVGGEKVNDYDKLLSLHDRLLQQDPPHSSPTEHTARVMTEEEYYTFVKGKILEIDPDENGVCEALDWSDSAGWCYAYRGFIPYRYLIDNGEV